MDGWMDGWMLFRSWLPNSDVIGSKARVNVCTKVRCSIER